MTEGRRHGGEWKVELSRAAVSSLRELDREAQRAVAARIRELERMGPPSGLGGPAPEPGGDAVSIRAGTAELLCLSERAARRIVVVTVRRVEEGSAPAAWAALGRWMRTVTGGVGMEIFVRDVAFAFRSLRRRPAFSVAAVLTLALGIGSATAIYGVADGVLLEPLPYEEPEEVVTVWASWDNFPEKTWLSIEEFQLFHQENRTLEDLALYGMGSANFTDETSPERVGSAMVTPNLFAVLGVEPIVGRVFNWEEARAQEPGVVLGHAAWQRRYGGDRSILERTVQIDGASVPVLGVLPPDFALPVDIASGEPAEVYTAGYVDLESPAQDPQGGGSHGYFGVGRLQDGATVADARADLQRIMQQVEPIGLYAPERRFTPRVFLAENDIVGSARGMILLLLGAVGLLLLTACGNVANLLLARSDARIREMAVRRSMGAGRGRIVRQLLTESFVLAGLGGLLGIGLAVLGVDVLLAIDPASVPRSASVGVDGSVLLFAIGAAAVTALVFGAIPALRVARRATASALREGRRGSSSGSRLQGVLVAAQMAMAVVLLAGSGLTIRTFVNLLEVDPGFGAENVLTLRVTAPATTYPDSAAVRGFYEELLRRVRDLPGVRSAGGARILPLATTMGDSGVGVEGYTPAPNEPMQAEWQFATPGYFETMGIPLRAGRTFDDRDRTGGREAIIVNESFRNRFLADRDPIGAVVYATSDTAVVVGVVGDVAHNDIVGSVKERFYRPHAQVGGGWIGSTRSLTLAVATEGDPRSLLPAIRGEIRALDPTMPISNVRTLEEVLASSVAQPRFAMVLLGSFAAIALLLAVVGIYGVLSYAVSRRTREIGIRMAVGAEPGRVVSDVVGRGMAMALLGITAGLGLAWVLAGSLEGMLYGVEAHDVLTFAVAPLIFVGVAFLACVIPALRAARVNPSGALRYE